MELLRRKQNRLKEYDYSSNGAYFITICTHNRKNLFWNVGDDAHIVQRLSKCGIIAEKYIKNIIGIEKYVVMPNHVHIIIRLDRTMKASSPTKVSIPQLIRSYKTMVTKECGCSVWQRSYHDHIIRNQQDYRKIWEYIDKNPQKWELDRYYLKGDA